MAKGVKFNKPPSFAARTALGRAGGGPPMAPQLQGVYKAMQGGASTRGQGVVPKAAAGGGPLVAGLGAAAKGGKGVGTPKGAAMVGRALRRTPVAF